MGVGSSGRNPTTFTDISSDTALDVNVVQTVGSGGGTEYTEDAASASDPVGVAQVLVRQDSPTALVSADGDNVARRGTNYGAAFSQIVDSNGNFVDTFGGGVQYTEGDIDATITGTAMMAENANELLPLQITNSDNLRVSIDESNVVLDVNVNGTVQVSNSGGGSLVVTPGAGTWDDATITGIGSSGLPINASYQGFSDGSNLQGARVHDLDTGVGSEYNLGVNLRGSTGGGSYEIPSDATSGIKVDLGADNDITGTVTANAGTNLNTSALAVETGGNLDTIAGDTTSIDGKITACNTGAVVVSSSALPSGASTAANQLPDGHNVTVDNASGASAVNIQDGGNSITVDGSVTVTQSTASSLNAQVVGEIAHDSADSGNPVKVGAKAVDYEPSSSGERGATAVAASDRSELKTDLRGRLMAGVAAKYEVPTNVSTTYNNTTTTATSAAIDCFGYRVCEIAFALTKANTPTDIIIEVQTSHDGTNFRRMYNGPLGQLMFDDTAAGDSPVFAYNFPICARQVRIVVTATGTTASATFTISDLTLYFRD